MLWGGVFGQDDVIAWPTTRGSSSNSGQWLVIELLLPVNDFYPTDSFGRGAACCCRHEAENQPKLTLGLRPKLGSYALLTRCSATDGSQ